MLHHLISNAHIWYRLEKPAKGTNRGKGNQTSKAINQGSQSNSGTSTYSLFQQFHPEDSVKARIILS